MKGVLLVTIYNIKIEDSETIISFIKNCGSFFPVVDLCIWDNSTNRIKHNFGIIPKDVKYDYINAGDNISLSKVYNTVLKKYSNYSYLFNLDQDSELNSLYFETFYASVVDKPDIGMYIPQIYYESQCVSPGKKSFFRNRYLKKIEVGITKAHNLLCITSGVILDIKKIKERNLFYDEHLTLYGVDTKFSIDYARCFEYIFVLNARIKHDLSMFNSKEDKGKKMYRLRNGYLADCYIAEQENFSQAKKLYIELRYLYRRTLLIAHKVSL